MRKSLTSILVIAWVVVFTAGLALAQNPVTFQVNMSIQKQLGNFDATTDSVVMRGNFEHFLGAADWAGYDFLLTLSGTPDVYTLQVNFPDSAVGKELEYKYVIVHNGKDTWENIDNRKVTVATGGSVLDTVYFNNRSSLGVTANITFQADMTDLLNKGWFDPAADTLYVLGGFNGWAEKPEYMMARDLFNPSLYKVTAAIDAEANTAFEWKFRAAPHAHFLDAGWESGANHKFTFTGNDTTLGAIKPNIGYAGTPLSQDVTVQFTVDARNATETYHNNLFHNIKGVWIKGDKPELGAWGGSWTNDDTTSVMVKMYDDGTNGGDKVAGDLIYSAQVLFTAGTMSSILYKYGIVADSTDTLNGGVSYLDNEAGFSVNHTAIIPDVGPNAVLPPDRFGSLRHLKNPHTFTVDMSVQEQLANFDPSKNILVMRGSFENEAYPNAVEWKGNEFHFSPVEGSPNLYSLTIPVADSAVGQTLEYKFVIEDSANWVNFETQGGTWETVGNRQFTVVAGGDSLPTVFFNDQSFVGKTANVTFQADMTDLLNKGWFDPAADTLYVVGGFNGWAEKPDYMMSRDLFNPSLYKLTASITAEPNTDFGWKFRAAPHAHFLDAGWEGGDNHTFTFTGADLTLNVIKPNIGYAGVDLPFDITVQFSVNVNGAKDAYNNLPFNNIKSVWMKGDKPELGAWGGSWTYDDTVSVMVRLYDDGTTKGDQTAGDGIWTTQVTFPKDSKSALLYKYGIVADGVDTVNGGVAYLDNEAGFGNNHSMIIPITNKFYTAPTDTFGSQRATAVYSPKENLLPTRYSLKQNYPNPFNPTTEINYDLPKTSKVRLTIYNMLGQKVATLVNARMPAGSYTATWNGRNDRGLLLGSGLYFYQLDAGSFKTTKKMLLMK
ncbi:starch binding domain protein [bacterium BMS3Abin05]|nr:starch binding domain protein [bacterium BMS3Abin05]GBE26147.1 starch binding domain protein [bacterium BMS3Bbin03]